MRTFNPPPDWPYPWVAPGWRPSPDWQPDPMTAQAAPEGWEWWVEAPWTRHPAVSWLWWPTKAQRILGRVIGTLIGILAVLQIEGQLHAGLIVLALLPVLALFSIVQESRYKTTAQ